MEPDSTTCENTSREVRECYPFSLSSENYQLYRELSANKGNLSIESQIIKNLQSFGLLPIYFPCTSNKCPIECQLVCKICTVIDRVQWVCEICGNRLPIRYGSFFLGLKCSLLQALQMILAWCEDADLIRAAKWFDVNPKVAALIFDKLDDIAVREHKKTKLGDENSVVMAEMYPDCLNRLSPDTTDLPNLHRILMLADTNHIPTAYKLYVLKDDLKKQHCSVDNQHLRLEIEEVILQETKRGSSLVTGDNVPSIEGAETTQQLAQHCGGEMQHFMTRRIWRQAVTLCAASRDLTAAGQASRRNAVQRYLDTSLYRLTHADGFFGHILEVIALNDTLHSPT